MNLLVLGPQGAGKGTQAKRIAAEYGDPARLDGRHVPRRDRRRGRSSAAQVEPILAAGELVPDELTVAHDPRAARRARRRATASSSTASRATWRRPRRSTRCSRDIGRELDAILFFDLPDEVGTERMLGARRRGGPRRRHARRDRAPARDLPLARPSRSSSTTARPASSSRCTPSASIDEVWVEIQDALEQVGGARVIIRKCAQRDRADGPRRRGRRRNARAARGAARAGRHDGRARPRRRGVHPLARRRPDVQGLQGLSGRDLPLAERR